MSSASANVTEPVSTRLSATKAASSVTSPATSTTVMSGWSLVPVMTTVTSWVRLSLPAPESSLNVMVYVAVTVSPSARYCAKLLSSAKSQAIEPSLLPLCVSVMALVNAVCKSTDTVAPVLATAVLITTADVSTSVSSASANVTEPVSTKLPATKAASSVTAPATSTTVMSGWSLVPVIVMVCV